MATYDRRVGCSFMVMCVLWLGIIFFSFDVTDAQVGVCYGRLGTGLPSPNEVVALYKQKNIRRMRIYNPDKDVLDALRNSGIELILGLNNDKLQSVASSQAEADRWVRENVQNYASNVRFRYIAVGNEVQPSNPAASSLLQAMRNIETAISSARLGGNIKVSTAIDTISLQPPSFPPSKGVFTSQFSQFLNPIIGFLAEKGSPLLVNLYPYFAYKNSNDIQLDYALFKPSTIVSDGSLTYRNLFDAQLDTMHAAVEKIGRGSLEIVVSESGWPTVGAKGANVENARTYNNNMIQNVKKGTPKKPNKAVETYIFAMFDENQKGGEEIEKHWGIYSPNKAPKYEVTF